MKKILVASLLASLVVLPAAAQTLAKIKSSGSVTMGVRDSSIPLSYLLGDGVFTGFQFDVCKKVLANIQSQLEFDDESHTVTVAFIIKEGDYMGKLGIAR